MGTFLTIFLIFVAIICIFGFAHSLNTNNTQVINQQETSETNDVNGNNENGIKDIDLTDITNYVYIDTETSSLEVDRGEVLQLSAIKLENKGNGEGVLKTFNKYIKPSEFIRIDRQSMKINGISLAKCQCPKTTAFNEFLDFCKGKIICGYNVKFDIDMIDDDMKKEDINLFDYITHTKDVLQEVKHSQLPTPNNKLVTVSNYLGFKCDKYHNALIDCLATMFVDVKLSNDNKIGINFEEIADAMSKDCEDTFKVNDDKCKDFFKGKNVCISGDFENISRKYMEEKIVECGGVVKSGMSKRVNIFINGYNPKQTGKERKYEELVNGGWDKIVKYNEADLLKEIS